MRLLVAGATGQLGAGLLEVMGEADCTMVPLIRARPPLRPPDPALVAEPVRGDVQRSLWGLDEATIEHLAHRTDAVVNLAGQTNWAAPARDLHLSHQLGAQHGYELARVLTARSGRPVPYVYASSVYTAGGQLGEIAELRHPPGTDRTVYEQAKWLAELRLAELHDGRTPLLMLRISALVGSSVTGQTVRRNSLYQLADRWGDLPGGVLPAMPGARVDALPRDVAAIALLRAVRHLVDTFDPEPLTCHLGLGESAPSLRGLLDAAYTSNPMRFRRRPRVVAATARQILWPSQNVHRFLPLTQTTWNALIGLRYVGLERIFTRPRLAVLLGDALPSADTDRLARLLFGSVPRTLDAPDGNGSMARFPG